MNRRAVGHVLQRFHAKTHPTMILIAFFALVACSSDTALPPDAFGNTVPRPSGSEAVDFDALDRGESIDFDWVVPCSFIGIAPSQRERYLIDRSLATASGPDGYVRSDFAKGLDVYIYNEGSIDGPDFALIGITMRRIDEDTIEMTGSDGELIANFIRDTSDPDAWGFCG